MGDFPSGQRGQTVNLLATPSVVRIHHLPPIRTVRLNGSYFLYLYIYFLFAYLFLVIFSAKYNNFMQNKRTIKR